MRIVKENAFPNHSETFWFPAQTPLCVRPPQDWMPVLSSMVRGPQILIHCCWVLLSFGRSPSSTTVPVVLLYMGDMSLPGPSVWVLIKEHSSPAKQWDFCIISQSKCAFSTVYLLAKLLQRAMGSLNESDGNSGLARWLLHWSASRPGTRQESVLKEDVAYDLFSITFFISFTQVVSAR